MDKQAANCLADSYAEDSNIEVSSEKQRMIKEQHKMQDKMEPYLKLWRHQSH
jgi:hypothetical protein